MSEKDNLNINEYSVMEALRAPGTLAVLGVLAFIGPMIEILPQPIADTILAAFSLPIMYIFIVEAILNRNIDVYSNIFLLLIMSFGGYLVNSYPNIIEALPVFGISALLSVSIALMYHVFLQHLDEIEKAIPGDQKLDNRFKFLFSFIPVLIFGLSLTYLLSIIGVV